MYETTSKTRVLKLTIRVGSLTAWGLAVKLRYVRLGAPAPSITMCLASMLTWARLILERLGWWRWKGCSSAQSLEESVQPMSKSSMGQL